MKLTINKKKKFIPIQFRDIKGEDEIPCIYYSTASLGDRTAWRRADVALNKKEDQYRQNELDRLEALMDGYSIKVCAEGVPGEKIRVKLLSKTEAYKELDQAREDASYEKGEQVACTDEDHEGTPVEEVDLMENATELTFDEKGKVVGYISPAMPYYGYSIHEEDLEHHIELCLKYVRKVVHFSEENERDEEVPVVWSGLHDDGKRALLTSLGDGRMAMANLIELAVAIAEGLDDSEKKD